jgi:hypothetical protein
MAFAAVECGKAFDAVKGLTDPAAAVASLKAFVGKRHLQWVGVIENSIAGPFYYGNTPTYVDFYLAATVDWIQALYLRGLPIWDAESSVKLMAAVNGIRGLASYSGYAGPLKTVRDGFDTLAPEVAAAWSASD